MLIEPECATLHFFLFPCLLPVISTALQPYVFLLRSSHLLDCLMPLFQLCYVMPCVKRCELEMFLNVAVCLESENQWLYLKGYPYNLQKPCVEEASVFF